MLRARAFFRLLFSGQPTRAILRLLPAYILNEGHVDRLSDALAKISA